MSTDVNAPVAHDRTAAAIWNQAVEEAVTDARFVFAGSCSTSHDVIEYMRALMLQAACRATEALARAATESAPSKQWIGPHPNAAVALDELRRSVAEVLGTCPDTWPEHGNAPLAIAAALTLKNCPQWGDQGPGLNGVLTAATGGRQKP